MNSRIRASPSRAKSRGVGARAKSAGGDPVDHRVGGPGREQHGHQQGEGIRVREGYFGLADRPVQDLRDPPRLPGHSILGSHVEIVARPRSTG